MTGSHSLAAQFAAVPPSLNLAGDDYALPTFPNDASDWLAGKRIAVISSHGPELPEIAVPIQYLRDRGAVVELVTQDWIMKYWDGKVVLSEWLQDSICTQADRSIADANPDDYHAVIIPGGAWNPIMLRTDKQVLDFLRACHSKGILIASLCHGPQVLISMDVLPKGTHITGVSDIRIDLRNAGFVVHEGDAVVFDETANVLTSRDPKDLGPFCEAIGFRVRAAS
jgi:protease I